MLQYEDSFELKHIYLDGIVSTSANVFWILLNIKSFYGQMNKNIVFKETFYCYLQPIRISPMCHYWYSKQNIFREELHLHHSKQWNSWFVSKFALLQRHKILRAYLLFGNGDLVWLRNKSSKFWMQVTVWLEILRSKFLRSIQVLDIKVNKN